MALGDTDKQEATNMKEEEAVSTRMYAELEKLADESRELKKEFKQLLRTGKRLRNIIATKEKENQGELDQMKKMQEELAKETVQQLKSKTKKLKKEEQQESKLSKEEAIILQNMLNELHDTYKHGEDIIAADKQLYEMIKELYSKDLEDYQLEVQDIEKG